MLVSSMLPLFPYFPLFFLLSLSRVSIKDTPFATLLDLLFFEAMARGSHRFNVREVLVLESERRAA